MNRQQSGMALVTVLLLLAAMFTMAVAVLFSALLGVLTTRNQIAFAQAEAELNSMLTHGLMLLEAQLPGPDELPLAPLLPAGMHWTRLGDCCGNLRLASPSPQQLGMEVMLQLDGGRLTVLRQR